MGALLLTVPVVEIPEAQRCDENRQEPAEHHSHEFREKQHKRIDEEHVTAHDKPDDALVNESGIWVQNCVQDTEAYGRQRQLIRRRTTHRCPDNQYRENQAEKELPQVVFARQSTERLC